MNFWVFMILETVLTMVAIKNCVLNQLTKNARVQLLGQLRRVPNQSLSCTAVRQEVQELEVQQLEVRPGVEGLGDGCPEAVGLEAGGPDARLSGLRAGGVLGGVLRCPRVVQKARVTLPSLEVREGEAQAGNECIHCLDYKFLSSCHLWRPGIHLGS